MNKKQKQANALTLAYECVKKLGWTHVRLNKEYRITYPTLRRIRDGKRGKTQTDEYCLQTFLRIMKDAYRRDLRDSGGDNAVAFLRDFKSILMAKMQIAE